MRCRRTRFKSEVNYSGKLWALFLRRFRKVAASSFVFSKKNWRKNVSTKSFEFIDQSYSGKDFICRKDTTKRIGGGQTKNIWREKRFNKTG